jgi:hypothetical protein
MSYLGSVTYDSGTKTTLSEVNGSVKFSTGININTNQKYYVRVNRASISRYIPNIYTYGSVSTHIVKVSRDDGVTWITITLDTGNYSISQINNAINYAIAAWYTDTSDPAFTLSVNTAISRCYITIDSTKLLAPGTQLQIDFSASSINELLGFVTTDVFTTDGLFDASDNAKIDWHGNEAYFEILGLGNISNVNGKLSNKICTVEFVGDQNQYTYTNNSENWQPVSIPSYFTGFDVKVVDRYNRNILIYDGYASITLEFKSM